LRFITTFASTPKETVMYESLVSLSAREAIGNQQFVGATGITLTFWMAIPKSRAKKLGEGDWHTQRPDVDNMVKAIFDGLNGVAWADDCVVVPGERGEAVDDWGTEV
jgi:Holliday junction resolvase RusA-like endonuclease